MSWIHQTSLTSNLKKMTLSHQGSKGKEHMYKSDMLWPLRNFLGMLNGTDSNSDGGTFPSKFNKLLTFSYFCKFIKAREHYFYNNQIPQKTCLCEICKNTSLLGKGLNNAFKLKDVPSDPDSFVEKYSYDSELRECMLNSCDECKHHGLSVDDSESGEANNDDSDSDSETNMVRYYQWKRGDDRYLTKLMVEADANEVLDLWQSVVETLKEHIHYKRRQFKEIRQMQFKEILRITDSLNMDEILIIAKTINESIRTKSKAHISAKNHSAFSPSARIIKMVNCQSQLRPRRVISRELHSYRVFIKSSPIHWKKSNNKSKLCILYAMGVPQNFNHSMLLAFLRIYTQILPSSGAATRSTMGKA